MSVFYFFRVFIDLTVLYVVIVFMEIWLILSLGSLIFFGISEFLSVVIAKNKLNKDKYIYWSILLALPVSFTYLIFSGGNIEYSLLFLFLLIIARVALTEKDLFQIKSLKYIESSIFFPMRENILIIGGFFTGMLFFNEFLNTKEYLYIFFAIIIISLFLDFNKFKVDKSFKKGFIFLIIASVMLVITITINKYVVENFDIPSFLFLSHIIAATYLIIKNRVLKKDSLKIKKDDKKTIILAFLFSICSFWGILSLLNALILGKIVIVHSIVSFSLFVPIILSYFVYKEKVNRKKILALVLFILNILFLY